MGGSPKRLVHLRQRGFGYGDTPVYRETASATDQCKPIPTPRRLPLQNLNSTLGGILQAGKSSAMSLANLQQVHGQCSCPFLSVLLWGL